MAHHDRGEEQHRRVRRMQTDEAVDHPFAMLIAELIAGDERNEQEPE